MTSPATSPPTTTARSRRRRGRLLAAGATGVLVLGLAACGDDADDATDDPVVATDGDATDGAGTDGDSGDGSAGGDTVVADDLTFTSATVAPGAEVTFDNQDGLPHTMTAEDGSFDSGTVEAGQSASITAPDEAGDHPFICEIHPAMTGTLTVAG